MWVLFHRFKVRKHERGLLFKDRDFKAVLRPGRRFVWDVLRKVRMDIVSVRDVWLTHKDLDAIAKSGALANEARVVDLKDHERAVVWVDGRIEAVLKPGLSALWTVFHDVRVEVFDARAVRFEHADLAVIDQARGASPLLEAVMVEAGHAGLFFKDGRHEATLAPGRPCVLEGRRRALADSRIARSRAGARHLLSEPSISRMARDGRLVAIASAALNSTALPFRATLFDKSDRANWLVVWHQDTALPLRKRTDVSGWGPWSVKHGVLYAHAPARALSKVVAVRLHLDDSLAANGPLRVLPGTHRRGVLTDDQIRALAGIVSPTECLVTQGGVVTMSPLLVHSSSKATVGLPRRVIHIEYSASLQVAEGLELAVA